MLDEDVISALTSRLGIIAKPYIPYNDNFADLRIECVCWEFPYPESILQIDPESTGRMINTVLDMAKSSIFPKPYLAYKGGGFMSVNSELAISDNIVLCDTKDQFDILRIEATQGNNFPVETDKIIEVLKQLDGDFGIEIIGACRWGLEFQLKKIPTNDSKLVVENAIVGICPDVLHEYRGLAKGRVVLDWD